MPLPRLSVSDSSASIVVLGESGVGKTCFTDMFMEGRHFITYNAFTSERRTRSVTVDGQTWKTWLIDLSSTTIRSDDRNLDLTFFEKRLARADGIVLLYDVTSQSSFNHVINEAYDYAWECRCAEGAKGEKYVTGSQRFGCLVIGNKADLVRNWPPLREVSTDMAEEWAASQGFNHVEVSSNNVAEVEDAITKLIKSIARARKQDMRDIENEKEEEAKHAKMNASNMTMRERISSIFTKSRATV